MSLFSTLGNIVGGAVSLFNPAIGGAISGVASNAQNQENIDNSFAWQREQLASQQAFNAQEAEKNRQFQAGQSVQQNVFNSNEAAKQRQWQEDMWNKQNEYNTPLANLQRMQAAGLNPMTFNPELSSASSAGEGASASGSAPAGSMASVGSVGNPSLLPSNNVALETAQARLANAQADSLEEDTSLKRDTHDNEVTASGLRVTLLGENVKMSEQQRENLKKDLEVADANIRKVNQEIVQSEEYTRFLRLQGDEKENYLNHFEEEFEKRMRALDDEHDLSIQNIREVASKIRLNLANIGLVNAQTGLANQQAEGQIIQNSLDGIELEYQVDNKTYIASMRRVGEKFNFDVSAGNAITAEAQASISSEEAAYHNTDFYKFTRALGDLTGAIGNVFRYSAGSYKSTSTSTSSSTVNSTSNSTVNSTSNNTNHNYNYRRRR